jgi:hypothetical protein
MKLPGRHDAGCAAVTPRLQGGYDKERARQASCRTAADLGRSNT